MNQYVHYNQSHNSTLHHPQHMDFHQPYQIKPTDRIIFWITSFIITSESSILLIIFLLLRSLRTVTNLMVISLTLSDLLNGAVLLPCVLLLGLNHAAVQPLMMLVLTCSMGNVCACALDRLIAIKYALIYKSLMVRSTCLRILVSIWTVATILTLVPKILGPKYENSVKFRQIFLGVILSILIILSTFLIAVYCYIFQIVRMHLKFALLQECRNKPKQKSILHKLKVELSHAKRFAIITLTFLACWFPLIYINFVADVLLLPQLIPMKLLGVSLHTIFLHSVINPVLYGLQQKNIRKLIWKHFSAAKSRDLETRTSCQLSRNLNYDISFNSNREVPRDISYSSNREVSCGKDVFETELKTRISVLLHPQIERNSQV